MNFKTAFVALVLGLTPAMAAAYCASDVRITASACGEGQVFDAASQTCIIPQTS